MRTSVVVVTGQGDTAEIAEVLLSTPGTALVQHRFDGHVVHRRTSLERDGVAVHTAEVLELTHGCVSCTVRDDLIEHLRRLHRRPDVDRIVIRLGPWLEPEPVCIAITRSAAARDLRIGAVITSVDSRTWLAQALGDEVLPDGRTVAQVAVGQVEFADAVVLNTPQTETLEVVRRLAPRSRITVGAERLALALNHLDAHSRRGCSDNPHSPLLRGQPPLGTAGLVRLLEFTSRLPFHPQRLYAAVDLLLDGVVRTRGRLWVASRPDQVMWMESAGGGLRVDHAGKWLASMTSSEAAYVDPQRRAMADLMWDYRFGDRHTSMTVLVCGADGDEVLAGLRGALLTDDEAAHPERWRHYPDPFGGWHGDGCDDSVRIGPSAPDGLA